MTHFLKDILRQPEELQRSIELLAGPSGARRVSPQAAGGRDAPAAGAGRQALEAAAEAVRGARHVYLTGIGSSWHAALNVGAMLHQHAHPVYLLDADELLRFAAFPKDAAMIIISRSGKSTEIVQLARKARQAGVHVVGITNAPDSPLAKEAHTAIPVPIKFDHAISVNTYTTLALATGLLATSVTGLLDPALTNSLVAAFTKTADVLSEYQDKVAKSAWLKPHSTTYFLARGSSLGSAYESRLMWEEGVKSPATAMATGRFRHGPQEIVNKGVHFGIWIDGTQMREQDFALARDLRKLGPSVMLVGQKVPEDAGDLVFQLPAIPAEWQFLIDIIPAQLVAERLAGLSGVDCDTFRLCSFVVEDEGGLLPKEKKKN